MGCTLAESPSDPFHRKLRQLRCLRRRFDCYRVERTSSRAGVAPAEVQRLFTAHCFTNYAPDLGCHTGRRQYIGTGISSWGQIVSQSPACSSPPRSVAAWCTKTTARLSNRPPRTPKDLVLESPTQGECRVVGVEVAGISGTDKGSLFILVIIPAGFDSQVVSDIDGE